MKVILEGALFGGVSELRNGKSEAIFIENGKIRKVRVVSCNLNGAGVGSIVDVEISGITSIFSNYGNIEFNAEAVEIIEV